MGINVCVKVLKIKADAEDKTTHINFVGKVHLEVVDEDTKGIKKVEWYLGDVDQFYMAYDRMGKVSYATVEAFEGKPKIWFLDKNPFDDGNWREELFYDRN